MEFEVDKGRVGLRLKAWRASRDTTGPEVAAAVAAASGRSFEWSLLWSIEKGETLPEPWVAEALAAVYEQPLSALIGPTTAEELEAERAAAEPSIPVDDRPAQLQLRSPFRPRAPRLGAREWEFQPGQRIRRVDLHDRFGGGRQGGIAPCRESANVLVFSDPSVGHEHGYFDRWEDDGKVFLYAGEGQRGDQEFVRGNAAILNHRRDGRALRVFEGCSGTVTYAGEFEVAAQPYLFDQAPETGGGSLRRVILFRLVPVG